jgi:hypothetical protein
LFLKINLFFISFFFYFWDFGKLRNEVNFIWGVRNFILIRNKRKVFKIYNFWLNFILIFYFQRKVTYFIILKRLKKQIICSGIYQRNILEKDSVNLLLLVLKVFFRKLVILKIIVIIYICIKYSYFSQFLPHYTIVI